MYVQLRRLCSGIAMLGIVLFVVSCVQEQPIAVNDNVPAQGSSGGGKKGVGNITATLFENFNSFATKGYNTMPNTQTVNGVTWTLDGTTIVANDPNDKKVGGICLRTRLGNSPSIKFTKASGGAGTIEIWAAAYGTDAAGTLTIKANGVTLAPTVPAGASLVKTTLSISNIPSGQVTFEITQSGGDRICIDDINVTDAVAQPPAGPSETEPINKDFWSNNDNFTNADIYTGWGNNASDEAVTQTWTGKLQGANAFISTEADVDFYLLPPILLQGLYVLELNVPATKDYDLELYRAYLDFSTGYWLQDGTAAVKTSTLSGNGVTEFIAYKNSFDQPSMNGGKSYRYFAKVRKKANTVIDNTVSETYTLRFRRTLNGKRYLFDASRRENASSADWQIDSDGTEPVPSWGAGGANTTQGKAQRIPTPSQLTIAVGGNTAETTWDGSLSAWAIELVKQGHSVETLPRGAAITFATTANPQDLQNYDAFIIPEPQETFSSAEITAIHQFVYYKGGGLFIAADHTNEGATVTDNPPTCAQHSDRDGNGTDSPRVLNQMTSVFGITFDLKEVAGKWLFGNNCVNANAAMESSKTLSTGTGSHYIYILQGKNGNQPVPGLSFYRGTTMTLSSPAQGLIYQPGAAIDNRTNVRAAYSTYGAGRIFAIGDSSPLQDATVGVNLAGDGTQITIPASFNSFTTDSHGNHSKNLLMNAALWVAKF